MTEITDYGRFVERLERVMPRWGERERMSPGEFAEHLADTGPRWELLREFQEEWGYESPGGEPVWHRWSEDEHKAYVRRLKAEWTGEEEDRFEGVDLALPIPKALDEWWHLPFNSFTHRPRLYWTNPEWPPTVRSDADGLPEDNPFVGPDGDRRICVFKAENQYCNEWGYLAAEAALPDPKVLVSTEDGWVVQSRSISEFFLQLAVDRLPAHYGWSVELNEADGELIDQVRRSFPELGLLPWREMGAEVVTYGAPDAIIYHDVQNARDFPFTVYARTRAALEAIARTLGVDWTGVIWKPAWWLSLRPGQSGDEGRWTVLTASDQPASPTEPASIPLAELIGGDEPAGRTVWDVDADLTIAAAGDQGGGLHLWRLDRTGGAPAQGSLDAETIRAGHDAPVTAIACLHLAGCGPTMLSGDSAGLVQMWSPDLDSKPAGIARGSTSVIGITVAELTTGPAIAAAWAGGKVRVWDVASGGDADLLLGPGIETLTLHPDGTLTVGGQTGTATVELDAERMWPQRELTVLLHRFDWESLRSAHGTAEQVPDRIIESASADTDTAEGAFAQLREALYEEGAVFPATSAAVPFLMLLVADPGNRIRSSLLSLLSEIAQAARVFTDHRLEPELDPELGRSWAEEAHEAIAEFLPHLSSLSEDAAPAVRAAYALLLANFPEHEHEHDALPQEP